MESQVLAEIRQGRLQGKKVTAIGGNEYYSFQGIPYAKPPVGPLRFKPPESAEPWVGLRDATTERAVCPSLGLFTQEYVGDEDCLFLNVYCPQWPPNDLKPVMFWIHASGYMVGSGNTDFYGPDYLVAEDVVLVTFNYRLGALGFLNLEGSDVTPNNGLRDQVMALTWVKENIAKFGGDPGNVTIFGESAGGSSAHSLMLSPLATGLFHRGIAQGGTALLPICFIPYDVSIQRALSLAKALGCTSEEPQEVVDFLRKVPANDLVMNQSNALSEQEKRRLVTVPFSPTIEKGSNRFFPEHPAKLLEKGKFTSVPFIFGVAALEGAVALIGTDSEKLVELGQDFQNFVPWDLATEIDTDKSRQIAARLKQFYFGDKTLNKNTVAEFADMESDLIFVYSMHTSVKYTIEHSSSPVYVFMFDHETPADMKMISFPEFRPRGAYHGEDMFYLFRPNFKEIKFSQHSPEEIVRSHMVTMWTQFAKTGDLSNIPGGLSWLPATKDNHVYLRIDETLKLEKDMFKERMEFMDSLYKDFPRVTN